MTAGAMAVLGTCGARARSAPGRPGHQAPRQVDVRRDFGAVGDGVADDWQAIERAGRYLEHLGGGRMYFPSGRYLLPTWARNITVRNNIEYFGDGQSSVIIGSNAAFISPRGAAFGRGSYQGYRYVPADDISAGDQSIRLRRAEDARGFQSGDILIARSRDAIVSPGDELPYFVEMNRVAAVSGDRLELEDVIEDGWHDVIVANVTPDVAQDYSIHDLRIECERGYPLFVQASYKSTIRNCWTKGLGVVCINGFARSSAHDMVSEVIWKDGGSCASAFEVETGSVHAAFHDIDVTMTGTSGTGARYPLFYLQEFSRRTQFRNIRISAPELRLASVFRLMSGAHRLENVEVAARSVEKVLDYWSNDPAHYQLNRLGMDLSNARITTSDPQNGYGHGFVLRNAYPEGIVENVAIRDCVLEGPIDRSEHNLIWFYQGGYRNVRLERVRGPGLVAISEADRGRDSNDLVVLESEFTRLASEAVLEQVRFVSCRRRPEPPGPIRAAPGAAWGAGRTRPGLAMTLSPGLTVCRGDSIRITISADCRATGATRHIEIRTMGSTALSVEIGPERGADILIDLRLVFLGTSFAAPDLYRVTGAVLIDGAPLDAWKQFAGSCDLGLPNQIEIYGWADGLRGRTSSISVKDAAIEFRTVESGPFN